MTADSPRAILRADASLEIGTGHIVRCLTLAEELRRRGWSTAVASRALHPSLVRATRAAGAEILDLPASLAIGAEPAFLASTAGAPGAVVVVDHYGIGPDWHRSVSGWATGLMAIDDLAVREQAVDLVLNQNLGPTSARYADLVPSTARVLAGPSYALVRSAFATARAGATARTAVGRILVFIGGGDPDDTTRTAAEGAAALGMPVDVVVGGSYPHATSLRELAAASSHMTVHVDTPDMARLMAGADVAVGAPSSASWERCTVGLPSVLVTVADNQLENAHGLAGAGAAIDLGVAADVTAADVERALVVLAADPARLAAMSVAAAAITDGQGTRRVADALVALARPGRDVPPESGPREEVPGSR